MEQRFVILRHEVNGGSHFDLLLELASQELLRALQLASWPLAVGESCPAPVLPPHRRIYLDYQGPISGGRGSVTRIDAGTWSGDAGRIVLSNGCRLEWHEGVLKRVTD